MKKSDTHAFVNQVLVCVLVTISCGGSIGLGTVWMRHQISVTAKANRDLNARIMALDRSLAEIRSQVESEQSIDVLARRNLELGLGLVEVTTSQVAHVNEDPVRRLALRANRELFATPIAAPSSSVRFALGQ
jgi:hypothetical protein